MSLCSKEVLLEILQGDDLKLYGHQAEAIDAVLVQRKDVVVSTSTGRVGRLG